MNETTLAYVQVSVLPEPIYCYAIEHSVVTLVGGILHFNVEVDLEMLKNENKLQMENVFETDRLIIFVSTAFSSCTCNEDSYDASDGYAYYNGGGYDCTCDETDDCASSHVIGGEVVHSFILTTL